MNPRYLTLCFLVTLLFPLSSSSAMNSFHSKHIPAIYVFGDSLIDCGNNNHLPGGGANFLPYGIDFMGGNKPTGRATNGKNVLDFLAIHLGLPFVPAYLRLSNHRRNKISTGINYASGSSGILPETNNDTSLTLDKQIKYFKRTLKHNLPKVFHEKEKLDKHISESLFFVSTGVNDNFSNGTFRGNKIFSLYLLNEFSLRIQKLYSLGARNFFVNNLPPAGCFPSKAVNKTPRGTCDEKINKAISFYNRRLPELLHELQSKLPGFTFIHSDLFGFFIEMRENAKSYGILETWKPCCPNTIYGDLKCRPNTVPCPNRDTHLFFDEHPTQAANQIYAKKCYIEASICKSSGLKLVSHA